MMNEGFPSAPKAKPEKEVVQEEKEWISTATTPEYWQPHQELPWSREYVGFQVAVARELATKSGLPLSKIGADYTTLFNPYVRPDLQTYTDVDSMSDEELVSLIHQGEIVHAQGQPPLPYHEYTRFGCFMYHAHAGEEEKGRVDIHFSNAELDETGPLGRDKIERRLQELKDVFTELHTNWPEAEYVRGDSWLYNVEAYRRLFPESYLANPEVDTTHEAILTQRTWGQFADDKMGLKKDIAEQFLANIRALEEITPADVREAMPYQALIVKASIADFYKKYGIE
jgi:hypothetical protein